MAGARMMKKKRGGKAQAGAAEGKPLEVAVETASEEAATSDAFTPQEVAEAPAEVETESAEGAGAEEPEDTTKSEGEKTTDDKETSKKRNRRKFKNRKGKKPSNGESASKEKKVIEFDGFIFMCNSDTKKDCFKYRVFGLPEEKKNIVEQVKKGTKLFLFDIDKRVLHGVYKASSEGGLNLIEEAFKDSDRKFPAQVRFRILRDCMPLDESAFRLAIKENYFRRNKFKCELNAEQVERLFKLFRPLNPRGLPESKPSKETTRDSDGRGKASRAPSRQWNREPRPRFSAPAPHRERVYKDYARYPREHLYPEGLLPSHALVPDVIPVEAELLRQRHLRQLQEAQAVEALDRRTLVLDPLVEASITRKRYLDDVYAAEQQALAKRPLLQDSLFRDLEYQRETPYRSYGDGLASHAGGLHYDLRPSQLGFP